MISNILWVMGAIIGLFLLDRILLWAEAQGWIYYRINKPGRGASTYHLFGLSSIYDPTFRAVQEEMVREIKEEDEDGDPPGPDDDPRALG